MKMDELEEKIMKILDDVYSDGAAMVHPDIRRKAGLILNLFSDLIKDIEWVGTCPKEIEIDAPEYPTRKAFDVCPKCNGTGNTTRPASIEEVLEMFPEILNILNLGGTVWIPSDPVQNALTINNGRLRIKEEL